MRMNRVVGRFAPSPSGRMHMGNLWSCLLAWLSARSAGGGMVLRLEDLDPDRCRQAYCDQVMRDLEWLGLDWDGAPVYHPKIITDAMAAGQSPIITSSMMFWVVFFPLKWGEEDTMSFSMVSGPFFLGRIRGIASGGLEPFL